MALRPTPKPEASALGQRLAKAEFARMAQDLDRLIAAPPTPLGGQAPGPAPPPRPLPPLPVPLGHIAHAEAPDTLPVIGVLLPPADAEDCLGGLSRLLGAHHQGPFARLLFVLRTVELLPFLGRYGFAAVRHPEGPSEPFCEHLARRFAMTQLRHLIGADRIWPR